MCNKFQTSLDYKVKQLHTKGSRETAQWLAEPKDAGPQGLHSEGRIDSCWWASWPLCPCCGPMWQRVLTGTLKCLDVNPLTPSPVQWRQREDRPHNLTDWTSLTSWQPCELHRLRLLNTSYCLYSWLLFWIPGENKGFLHLFCFCSCVRGFRRPWADTSCLPQSQFTCFCGGVSGEPLVHRSARLLGTQVLSVFASPVCWHERRAVPPP